MELTVSDIQAAITRGKSEFDARIQELRAQRAYSRKRRKAHQRSSETDPNLGTVYHQSTVWLTNALLEAKHRENNQSSGDVKSRQDAEEFARNAALASYTQAGGNPDQFDILWPEIRFTQIQKVIAQKQSEQPARKPLNF